MRAKIIRIGNSRGIRIPSLLLKESGLKNEVELRLNDRGLTIRPIEKSGRPKNETTLLSEPALGRDWSRLEEDRAWAGLMEKESDLDVVWKQLAEIAANYLPLIGPTLKIIRLGSSFADYLMARKIGFFLRQLKNGLLNTKLVEEFAKRAGEPEWEAINEKLIFALEKADSREKAELIGKAFTALINKHLSVKEFYKMIHVVNGFDFSLFGELRKFYDVEDAPGNFPQEVFYSFLNFGLITINTSMIGTMGGGGPSYERNDFGRKFIKIIT